MSEEVDFILDELASVVAAQSEPLRRIDRDRDITYVGAAAVANTSDDDIIRTKSGDPTVANYVGASLADESLTPIGTEYDHDIERTVAVRVEGADVTQGGHIDPADNNGVPFAGADGLVDAVREAILAERTFPAASGPDIDYHSLRVENVSPDLAAADFTYRTDLDVVFEGYEDLP